MADKVGNINYMNTRHTSNVLSFLCVQPIKLTNKKKTPANELFYCSVFISKFYSVFGLILLLLKKKNQIVFIDSTTGIMIGKNNGM